MRVWAAALGILAMCFSISLRAEQREVVPIDITADEVLDIKSFATWCSSDPSVNIEEISSGGCQFHPINDQSDISHGLSRKAFWLKIKLYSRSESVIERWLRVGHPRIGSVTLFSDGQGKKWQEMKTGLDVPSRDRPIQAEILLLPIKIAPDVTETYYLRFVSETAIDLSADIFPPSAFPPAMQASRLAFYMSLGSASLAFLFCVIIYIMLRQVLLIYFAGTLLFTVIYDAGYTGLLAAYLWPTGLPFPIIVQLISSAAAVTCFSAFILSYMGSIRRLSISGFVAIPLLALLFGIIGLSIFVGYRDVITSFVILVFLILVALAAPMTVSKDTPRDQRIIFFVFLSPVLLILLIRSLMISGVLSHQLLSSLGFSFPLTILSPIIIMGILQSVRMEQERIAKLEIESNLRSQYLSHISHEFRSPLNLIVSYARLIGTGSRRVTLDEAARAIQDSGHELLLLIDNILDYLRRDQGIVDLDLVEVRLDQFLREIALEADRVANVNGNRSEIKYTGVTDGVVRIDGLRLKQVLRNLIGNANRYTEKGVVTLTCHVEVVAPNRCSIFFSVRDTGIGISPKDIQRIFEPYVRGVEASRSAQRGFGIGLALSQRLISMMGSRIIVQSNLGTGSEFSVTIDCHLVEGLNFINARPLETPKRRRLLLIDDDPRALSLLQDSFVGCGYEIISGGSGQEADQYSNTLIDLVITDQFMSPGDGWSVLKRFSERGIPVILLSAAEPRRPVELPDTIQFAAVFQKPTDAKSLLLVVRRIIGPPVTEFGSGSVSFEK